jgi:hypothetical protein
MTIAGSLYDINRGLWNVMYVPDAGYSGPDTVTLIADDKGNTGDVRW